MRKVFFIIKVNDPLIELNSSNPPRTTLMVLSRRESRQFFFWWYNVTKVTSTPTSIKINGPINDPCGIYLQISLKTIFHFFFFISKFRILFTFRNEKKSSAFTFKVFCSVALYLTIALLLSMLSICSGSSRGLYAMKELGIFVWIWLSSRSYSLRYLRSPPLYSL